MVPATEPAATSDLGTPEGGGTRRLLLDELLAERARPPLPPAPVLTVDPVAVDAAAVAGRRGARKRLVEVEALARRNLRAAEEARRIVHEERQLLEEEASARTKAEGTAAALRREIERLRSGEEQRAAQARLAATTEARSELAIEIERVHDEHTRVVDELDRMRGTLFDHDSLLDEYSRRLRDEQESQGKARAEQARAEEALRVVERNLEIATETARRRAEEDLSRFNKVEEAWRDACVERDRAAAELHRITTGDGELARLRGELEATHEDMTRVLADLDSYTVRAERAEAELSNARETRARAELLAAEATDARDLAGIALETTRSELAEKAEALDAERSASQSRIAELVAQLATSTRTAESATERSADLESRLDASIAARDEAVAQTEKLTEQLARARADTEVLRTQAASIGDELGATQAELERARAEAEAAVQAGNQAAQSAREAARQQVQAAQDAARLSGANDVIPAPTPIDGVGGGAGARPAEIPYDAAPAAPPVRSTFDAALASAFGDAASATPAAETAPDRQPLPVVEFRTVEAEPGSRKRKARGPIVDIEVSLARGIEPDEVAGTDEVEPAAAVETGAAAEAHAAPERSPETQAWRRTAMAELTALASDSDDLTPRRHK
jgi:predicted  nucleic acid-binding Zn-ribbon protein